MDLSLNSIANAFYLVSASMGVPSLSGIALVLIYRLHAIVSPPSGEFVNARNPDAILLIVGGMAAFIQKIAQAVGFLGRYVVSGVAILSLLGVVVGAGLWVVGRGLQAHRAWALTTAGLVLVAALVLALVIVCATRGIPRYLALSIAAFCGAALISVRRGFPI